MSKSNVWDGVGVSELILNGLMSNAGSFGEAHEKRFAKSEAFHELNVSIGPKFGS